MKNPTAEELKKLRYKIDGMYHLTKSLKPINGFDTTVDHNDMLAGKLVMEVSGHPTRLNSPEIEDALRSLFLGKAWLGKVLESVGEATPYVADDQRKELSDVRPTAENAEEAMRIWIENNKFEEKDHVEKVSIIRGKIEAYISEVKNMTVSTDREAAIARTNAYNYLCDAKMWLGAELGRHKRAHEGH
jgi:hypothetical protein